MKSKIKLSPVFLPTIILDDVKYSAVVTNKLPVRTGQWVFDGQRKGQVVDVRNGQLYVSVCGKGDGFYGRTQRFVRAVQHHKGRVPQGVAA